MIARILKVFDYVPGVVYATVITVLVQVSTHYQLRAQQARTALAEATAQYQLAVAQAEQTARAAERAMQSDVESLAHDHYQKEQALAARAADGVRAVASLRNTIATLNSRDTPTDPQLAACTSQAATARDLLGTCAERYQAVAEDADRLSNQVTGLQAFTQATKTARSQP